MDTLPNTVTAGARLKIIGRKDPNTTYDDQIGVRMIISNKQGNIIILHNTKGNYYKLPGKSIGLNEDHHIAAFREGKEKTGCVVGIDEQCMAIFEEWSLDSPPAHPHPRGRHILNYCYPASFFTDTGKLSLTPQEIEDKLQRECYSVTIALEKMRACEPRTEVGKAIKERDIFFVETYAERQRGLGLV